MTTFAQIPRLILVVDDDMELSDGLLEALRDFAEAAAGGASVRRGPGAGGGAQPAWQETPAPLHQAGSLLKLAGRPVRFASDDWL